MKKTVAFILFFALSAAAFAGGKGSAVTSDGEGRVAGASSRRGRGQEIKIAVLAPKGINFTAADQYLGAFTQGRLNTLFRQHSAMTIVERQNLDKVLDEQRAGAGGAYSEENFVSIGRLVNARCFLDGTIIRISGAEFSVELGVTDTESGERLATFAKNCDAAELQAGKVINEAAVALLSALGVELSDAEKQEILGSRAASEGDSALAKAITAQKSGNTIEAMNYYYQAASFDPSLGEARNRLDALSLTATGGDIGRAVQSDYEARMTWLTLFKECAAYYKAHPPFEIVYEPDIPQPKEEEIDFQRETATLSFRIALVPSESGFQVLNGLLERLDGTGSRSKWGFAPWPLDVEPRESAASVFAAGRGFNFNVEAVIVNGDGKILGRAAVALVGGAVVFSSGGPRVEPPEQGAPVIFRFPGVNANDITENMAIRITKIDGMDAGTAGERGYMRIAPSRAAVDNAQALARRLELEAKTIPHLLFKDGTITGYTGPGMDIAIPAKIKGRAVTKIGPGAFYRKGITSVIIPNSVTSIAEREMWRNDSSRNGAFENNLLTSVTIPNSVTSIGGGAFENNRLTSVTIPNSVTSIGVSAFSNNRLTSVIIPNSVTSIGGFSNNRLTSITIPNGVTQIKGSAFYNNRLNSVIIPNSVTSIGNGAFDETLVSITIGNNVEISYFDNFGKYYNGLNQRAGTYIYNGKWTRQEVAQQQKPVNPADDPSRFYKLKKGTIVKYTGPSGDIKIPADIKGQAITGIGSEVFFGKGLTSVTIPNSVTSIGDRAFTSNRLTSVTIPNSVTSIGNSAFENNRLTSVTIPNRVKSIGGSAFKANNLTSVTIPNSVTSIRESMFASNSLTNVIIPNSVTYIGGSAFKDNNLTSITIPDSVTQIGFWVFVDNNLVSITIGAKLDLWAGPFGIFDKYYEDNGKRAGTYVLENGRWRLVK